MKRINFLLLVILALFASSCTEVITVDLRETEPILVVEGILTNEPGPVEVQLSLTGSYFKNEQTPRVSDATVEVWDDMGNNYTLQHTADGLYSTANSVTLQPFRTYFLKILFNGKEYTSQSYMDDLLPIDSLTYQYREESLLYEEGFYVTFHTQEGVGDPDFYRFYFANNGILEEGILVANDLWVEGNYINLEFDDYAVDFNDTVQVSMYSLTKEVHDFYEELAFQIESAGAGPFAVPPANAKGNISNGALGIFSASAVSRRSIIIQ